MIISASSSKRPRLSEPDRAAGILRKESEADRALSAGIAAMSLVSSGRAPRLKGFGVGYSPEAFRISRGSSFHQQSAATITTIGSSQMVMLGKIMA